MDKNERKEDADEYDTWAEVADARMDPNFRRWLEGEAGDIDFAKEDYIENGNDYNFPDFMYELFDIACPEKFFGNESIGCIK